MISNFLLFYKPLVTLYTLQYIFYETVNVYCKRYIVTIVNKHTFIHCDYRYKLLRKCLMSMTFDKLMTIKIPEGYNNLGTFRLNVAHKRFDGY